MSKAELVGQADHRRGHGYAFGVYRVLTDIVSLLQWAARRGGSIIGVRVFPAQQGITWALLFEYVALERENFMEIGTGDRNFMGRR